jgi:CO dehydrogenase maturation factor
VGLNIAIAGKGGTGKTTITGLLLKNLKEAGKSPILAVDADANSNLPDVLGLKVGNTIGRMIANFIDNKEEIPSGMTKDLYIEMQLNKLIIESESIDLLVMGRGEGSGCYCYPNLILRKFIDSLTDSYEYVVIDNEAGLEHLNRRLTDRIDFLWIVSDHSIRGIRTAKQILEIIGELKLAIKHKGLVVNRSPDGLDSKIMKTIDSLGIEFLGNIPFDDNIVNYDLSETPLINLPEEAPSNRAIRNILHEMSLI